MLPWTSATNWALNQAMDQSSLHSDPGYSYNAVDGNTGSDYHNDRCTATVHEANPWWSVDLGQEIIVTSLMVVNRADCCSKFKRILHIAEHQIYTIIDTYINPSLPVIPVLLQCCRFAPPPLPVRCICQCPTLSTANVHCQCPLGHS